MIDLSLQREMDESGVSELSAKLNAELGPHGFELHPLLVGWYNERVGNKFLLDYPSDTLAFVVISQPNMFEKAFLPYLSKTKLEALHDPIDECMLHFFSIITSRHPDTVALHDFQLNTSRRPKVLVQTAGHVSGAVRFYQPEEVREGDLDKGKKYFPVCHHPIWGGWFALRGVIIFSDIKATLSRRQPADLLTVEQISELVRLYNGNWQDSLWRNVGREENDSRERYSDLAIEYFNTKPEERMALIKDVILREQ